MTPHRSRFTRIATALALCGVGAALLVPQLASAEPITGILASAVGSAISVVLYFLNYVAVILFSFAGLLTSFFLDLNYQVLADTNRIVTVGWGICRDIANLGLVLLLVIIAIATIVRFKDYAAKTALPKLIAAALIVNFSFAIAQVFIDFSHSITRYFFQSVNSTGGIVDTVQMISGAFNPQRLLADPLDPEPTDPTEMAAGSESLTTGALVQVSSLAFALIFTLIAAFTLIAFAFSLLARYIWLTFLVIISPLAWLFWAFPGLSGQSGKWWSKFLQWVFFAPIASFFTYLALTAVRGMGSIAPVGQNFVGGGTLAAIISQGAQMFLMAGLLLGGLMMGSSMGISGAGGAMKMVNSGVGKVKGWAGAQAKGGAVSLRNRAAVAGTDADGKTALERAGSKKFLGMELRNIPLAGRVFTSLSSASSNTKAAMADGVTKKAKGLENETKENLLALSNRLTSVSSPDAVAAHAIAIAKAGGWDDLPPAKQQQMMQALRQTDSGEKILAYQPELAPEFEGRKKIKYSDVKTRQEMERPESAEERRLRITNPSERDKIISAAVRNYVKDANDLGDLARKNPAVVRALSSKHISQLADIEVEEKVVIKETLERDVKDKNGAEQIDNIVQQRKHISDIVKEFDEAKDRRATDDEIRDIVDKRKAAESWLKGIMDDLSETGKEALRVRDTMADNAGWNDTFPGGSGKKK